MAIGLVFFYGPTICRSVLKMKFFGLVPVACYVIFSYQNDKIRELTSSTIQIIALNLFHSGILFFFVVPVCCFYLDELMRFTKRKYPFQVFILSIFFLFLFPISDWNKLFEQADRGCEQEDPADRRSAASPQDAGGTALACVPQGADRSIRSADVLSGDEPGGVPEQ